MGPFIWNFVVGSTKCQFHASQFCSSSPILETENCVSSQCPEFYAEDALMLSQVIYLGLLWLGLIVLLNPGVTMGNFTKKYLKLRWWLIINSMWTWVVIPFHLEAASYYPVISVTVGLHKVADILEEFTMIYTSIAVSPEQLATANLRLLFLPAYLPFLNPIKEVFGWLKRVIKQGTPTGTEDLFNLLQAGIHTLPAETAAKFYGHADLFIPACLAKQPIN
ncbi:hypothetical protein DSO57_1035431 [Entomophthora muscae]|uniref:Uncharacterized protein n=1 Tax=Entomophthora muscae TaxID=34485 RepID=A0ACC2TYA5_9FUNG|nr:hypothetical protein DSO57_1035431 [Entomophthora muscae]